MSIPHGFVGTRHGRRLLGECLESRCVPAATFGFAHTIGSTNQDLGAAVATDAAGNSYVTGTFAGTVDFDAGPGTTELTATGFGAMVAKYDRDGALVWARQLGSANASGGGIGVDAGGNVYSIGSFRGVNDFDPGPGTFDMDGTQNASIYFSKLDPAGNFVWARSVYNPFGRMSLAVDATGNMYVTGEYTNGLDLDPGPGTLSPTSAGGFDVFVIKVDSTGALAWGKIVGGTQHDIGYGIAVDDAGNVYTTGEYGFPADFDPGPGTFVLPNPGQPRAFLTKWDADGDFVWARNLTDGDGFAIGLSVAVDRSGNVFAAGQFDGVYDFDPGPGRTVLRSPAGQAAGFVTALDADGNYLWAKKLAGTDTVSADRLVVDDLGYVYATGYFRGSADFDPGPGTSRLTVAPAESDNSFLVKLDPAGKHVWAGSLGRGGNGRPFGVAVSETGDLYTTGYFNDTGDFDPGPGTAPRTSAGTRDLYLSALRQARGPLTYATQPGDGADRLVLRRRGNALEVFDARTKRVVATRPADEVTAVTITGADGEVDALTVDYAGGPFRPPGEITFLGGAGGPDAIDVRGADRGYTLTDTAVSTASGVLVTLAGVEAAALTGGKGNNVIDASTFSGTVVLDGGAGNDVLIGSLAGGLLLGKAGNDALTPGGATTTASGGAGIDVLVAAADAHLTLRTVSAARAELAVTALNQTPLATHVLLAVEAAGLTGGPGDNGLDAAAFRGPVSLTGGAGNDRLVGGPLADVLFGGDGDDALTGNGGADAIDGGAGTDTLVETANGRFALTAAALATSNLMGKATVADALVGIDRAWLTGGTGANRLDASQFAGPVTLAGGAGNDELIGGGGPDSLVGGAGTDSLTGGAGADVFSALDTAAEYVDFDAGGGDVVA